MASPRIIIQILISGAQIFGKAFAEAGKQAIKNAKHSPQSALGADAAGVSHANSGSVTDNLTRQHRMTVDEAHLVLNVKRGEQLEKVLAHYEHLFKQNAQPPPLPKSNAPASKQKSVPAYSHYLQSKVVRAKERIEAELKIEQETPTPPGEQPSTNTPGVGSAAESQTSSTNSPPPPGPGAS